MIHLGVKIKGYFTGVNRAKSIYVVLATFSPTPDDDRFYFDGWHVILHTQGKSRELCLEACWSKRRDKGISALSLGTMFDGFPTLAPYLHYAQSKTVVKRNPT